MARKNGNTQSRATFLRHSAVRGLLAVLLRKVCNVCKTVDGIHFVRNLIRAPASLDSIRLALWLALEKKKTFSCPFTHSQKNM